MKIQNEQLSLEVTLLAAEMTSLIDHKSGREILWQGDPAFWSGRNPILFPIVGSTFDKKIHLFGKEYVMGNHGFARQSTFKLLSQSDQQITLILEDNETTLAQYPFHFALTVCYSLSDKTVNIDYLIENKDEKKMPFSFGLHPAFAIDHPDAAYIQFPTGAVIMNDAFFEKTPTKLLVDPQFDHVDLIHPDLTVRVGVKGYRWLAFWKKPGAKFICIEPWHGHGDHDSLTTDFYEREGTIVLEPGETWTTSYSISIL